MKMKMKKFDKYIREKKKTRPTNITSKILY